MEQINEPGGLQQMNLKIICILDYNKVLLYNFVSNWCEIMLCWWKWDCYTKQATYFIQKENPGMLSNRNKI